MEQQKSSTKFFMEPFRIKAVEPIRQTTRLDREKALNKAGLNLFLLPAKEVMIDLLTDSGTGAMSANQWSALMQGDESYAGADSFFRLEKTVRNLTGMEHVIPVHQGRGAEQILFSAFKGKGEWVVSNMLFDTTRANAELSGFKIQDLPCEAFYKTIKTDPFKGNIHLEKLNTFLKQKSVALVIITITNNSAGGQPVSMQNIKEVSLLCKKHQVPLVLDACRFAENAWFIKQREHGFKSSKESGGGVPTKNESLDKRTSLRQIAKSVFDLADITYVSAKKDGLSNSGGFLALRDKSISQEFKNRLIPSEGFLTYGGMTGRDMETVAVGLLEALDEDYLHYRIGMVQRLHDKLKLGGVPVVSPSGGHAVFVDAGRMLPHIPSSAYPAEALALAFYLFSGVRTCEVGSVMLGGYREGKAFYHSQELLRLALPRRTYTLSHIDYVAESLIAFSKTEAKKLKGVGFVYEPSLLRHFTARFKWL